MRFFNRIYNHCQPLRLWLYTVQMRQVVWKLSYELLCDCISCCRNVFWHSHHVIPPHSLQQRVADAIYVEDLLIEDTSVAFSYPRDWFSDIYWKVRHLKEFGGLWVRLCTRVHTFLKNLQKDFKRQRPLRGLCLLMSISPKNFNLCSRLLNNNNNLTGVSTRVGFHIMPLALGITRSPALW